MPTDNAISHILGCARQTGFGPNTRHTAINNELYKAASLNMFTTWKELALDSTGDARMDLVLRRTNVPTWIDVTVYSGECTSCPSEKKCIERKRTRYGELAKADGAVFAPFILEANGGWSEDAIRIANYIGKAGPISAKELSKSISVELQTQNAFIMNKQWRQYLCNSQEQALLKPKDRRIQNLEDELQQIRQQADIAHNIHTIVAHEATQHEAHQALVHHVSQILFYE